jgi:transposase
MSDDYQRIELITGTARRRRWTTEQKLRIIEASYAPGESVSSAARRHGGGAEPALSMAAPDGGGRRGVG